MRVHNMTDGELLQAAFTGPDSSDLAKELANRWIKQEAEVDELQEKLAQGEKQWQHAWSKANQISIAVQEKVRILDNHIREQ